MTQVVSTPKLNRPPEIKPSGQGEKLRRGTRPDVNKSTSQDLEQGLSSYPERENEQGMSISAVLILGAIAVLLDIVDLLDFTGIGAIITTIISFCFGAAMFVALYFFDKGDYNFARQAVAWITEIIPGIGILPINTFAVFLSWYLSRPQVKKKLSRIVEATEAGKAIAETAGKISKTTKIVRAGK